MLSVLATIIENYDRPAGNEAAQIFYRRVINSFKDSGLCDRDLRKCLGKDPNFDKAFYALQAPGRKILKTPLSKKERLYKTTSAAKLVGVGAATIRKWRDDGLLEGVKRIDRKERGRGYYWTCDDVTKMMFLKERNSRVLPVPSMEIPFTHRRYNYLNFSEKQVEIANLLLIGMKSKEIAQRLFLNPSNVDYHVSQILKKLGLSRRTQLISRLIYER